LNFKIAVAVSLLAVTGLAQADGTLANARFTVTYTTAAQNLFDDPLLLGTDLIRWRPTQFVTDSDALLPLTSTALITIEAKPGFDLSGFRFSESGTYEMGGFDTVPAPSYSANAAGAIKITPLNPGAPLVSSAFSSGTLTAATFDGVANTDNGPASWGASAAPLSFGAGLKKVSFWVSDTLWATANDTASSVIRKTTAELRVDTTAAAVVPEPETWAMMLAGLGSLVVMARRRRAD
jgi:PEP-CTERM motif